VVSWDEHNSVKVLALAVQETGEQLTVVKATDVASKNKIWYYRRDVKFVSAFPFEVKVRHELETRSFKVSLLFFRNDRIIVQRVVTTWLTGRDGIRVQRS